MTFVFNLEERLRARLRETLVGEDDEEAEYEVGAVFED